MKKMKRLRCHALFQYPKITIACLSSFAGFGPRRQVLTRLDREVWYFEVKMIKIK